MSNDKFDCFFQQYIMQNLSNYSNSYQPPQRNPAYNSIQSLQKYIAQLTIYINQNNHKYNKNMHTLKQYYQAQIYQLQSQRNDYSDDISGLKNELNAARDIIANKTKRIGQLQRQLEDTRLTQQISRQKLMAERKKIDQIYEEMSVIRNTCNIQIERLTKIVLGSQQQISNLNIKIREKESEINKLNQNTYKLQTELSERYSLPEKIIDIEKQNQKLKTALQINKKRLLQTQQKKDYLQAQTSKYRRQNQSLRITKGTHNAEKSLQIQKAIKQERENMQYKIKQLQTQNQSLTYQLNEAINSIKLMKKQIDNLENQIKKGNEKLLAFERQAHRIGESKDAYIQQFGSLKNQYEGVIQRLQDSLIDYQKKNWTLEEQNKELNDQLEALQQLLRQLKAINNLPPLKRQYRRQAQIQLIATQSLKKQNSTPAKPAKKQIQMPFQSDFSNEWQKLMGQIQKIKT